MTTGPWGFPLGTPALKDVPKPTNDAEADEWIAATIQALDTKAAARLYRILYNQGHRVNR